MAVRYPSKHFDGMQDNWFHYDCFWNRVKKAKIDEASVRGMEWLKWEDQELIRQRIIEIQGDAIINLYTKFTFKIFFSSSGHNHSEKVCNS